MESVNTVVDDSIIDNVEHNVGTSFQMDDESENMEEEDTNTETANAEPENNQVNKGPSIRIQKYHPK